MKSLFATFLMLVLALAILKCAKGLNCPVCSYYTGISDHDMGITPEQRIKYFDESCDNGNVPNSTYFLNCTTEGVGCGGAIFDGYLRSNNNSVHIVMRLCMATGYADLFGGIGCHSFETIEAIRKKMGVKEPIPLERTLTPNTRVTACYYDKDESTNMVSKPGKRNAFVWLKMEPAIKFARLTGLRKAIILFKAH